MGLIRHVWPWYEQPQEFAPVDPAKLAEFGVVAGWLAGGGREATRDVQTGSAPGYSHGAGEIVDFVETPYEVGRALRYTEFVSGTRLVSQRTGSVNTRAFTWFCRVRLDVQPSTPGVVCRDGSTGAGSNILLWRQSSAWDMRVGGTDYTQAGTWNLGQWYDVEIVSDASSCQMWVNGTLVINGGVAGAGSLDASLCWGDPSGGGIGDGHLALQYSLFCNRALTAAERAEVRGRPWQLFAPRTLDIPYTSAAPGIPTLSAPTFVPGSKTSTGWRGRITAT